MFGKIVLISMLGMVAVSAFPSKIEPRLVKTLACNGTCNVFVRFSGTQTVISAISNLKFPSRGEKISSMVSSLKANAEQSQKSIIGLLKSLSSPIQVKSFWISNEVYIKGADSGLIRQIATIPEVTEIYEEKMAEIIKDVPFISSNTTFKDMAIEWGIEKIQADLAWNLPGGNNGQGVVVANIDTGVMATHEALRGNFRQEYGWFDAMSRSETPHDVYNHGTHCMGTLAGSNGIGVAPGAQWIACIACNWMGACPPSALVECAQWILCPTRPNGTDEDCSKSPTVVSNSWGFHDGGYDYFQEVVAAWVAADIVPVFIAGNERNEKNCGSLRSPGDYANVITVGSTDSDDNLSYFSSEGPGRQGQIKPEITAPGSNIRSASGSSDTEYIVSSGTSMATPHVAGVVALIQSNNPNITVAEVMDLLINTVDTDTLNDTGNVCGGRNSTTFPNHQYGYGRLNARKALEASINA